MENYNGVLYCDAYMEDEFSIDDLESMRKEIRMNYSSRSDVILKKVGAYSVSPEAQTTLWKGVEEFRNFVYVADNVIKKNSAEYAANHYMKLYNTRVAATKEEAYEMLSEKFQSPDTF